MKYIVYLTICLVNNKIYIGVHKTDNPEVFCGYIGNGVNIFVPSSYKKSKTPFQFAVNKYGVENFKRITIAVFDNKEDAFKLESELVTEEFVKRSDTYNMKVGGEGGCAPQRLVKIYMYDLDGNFEMEFNSALDCAKYLNPNAKNGSPILKAIRLGQILYNHQFSKEKLPYMKKYKPAPGSHNNKIKVGKYDENGVLLETFNSVSECINAGYKNVQKSLRTGRKCKGFVFKKI